MDDEPKTLEERTACRLFSRRVIDAVARYQYGLPEPPDWDDHDDAVEELRSGIVDLIRGEDPAVIAAAIHRAVNDCELVKDPIHFAHMLGWLGLYLDSELLDREQRKSPPGKGGLDGDQCSEGK